MAKALTDKQIKEDLFARHYANTLNVPKAYELAGFEPDSSNANKMFKRASVQKKIQGYIEQQTARLDISIEKTLKHLAAIAYSNPLDCIHVDEEWIDDQVIIHGTRVKSPSEIPPWIGVAMTKIKENASPDGGITMEYGFESKVPALRTLLEYLTKTKSQSSTTKIIVKHKSVGHDDTGPKIVVKT